MKARKMPEYLSLKHILRYDDAIDMDLMNYGGGIKLYIYKKRSQGT